MTMFGFWRRRGVTLATGMVLLAGSIMAAPAANAASIEAPSAPTGLTTSVGATAVTLSWATPSSTGGVPVNYYVATSSPATTECYVVVSLSEPTTCTFSNLTQGTPYSFSVAATNTHGLTGPAASVGPVTPETAPDAPTSVSAAPSGTTLDVSWAAPLTTGGSPLASSVASAVTPAGTVVGTCTAAAPATSCVIGGLQLGATYSVSVTATNAAGLTSVPSAASSATPLAFAPDPPSNVTAVGADSSVVITWDPSPSNGGRPISAYTATAYDAGLTPAGSCTATPVTSGPLSCSITRLTNGATYTTSVVASNSVGSSLASVPSSTFTPEIGNPASFDDFVARLIKDTRVDLTATGTTFTLSVPPTSKVLGIAIHGTFSVHVDSSETSTWTASAVLPAIFGGTQATLHAVITAGQVQSLSVSGAHASIAGLFSVDRIGLVYGPSGWVLEGQASVPSHQSASLSGNLTISLAGTITNGSIHVGGLSLAGLIDLSSFDLSYSTAGGWVGSATFANLLTSSPNGSGATIHLGFSPAGKLTSGAVNANGPVSIFGVITLTSFRLGLDPSSGRWDAAMKAAIPATTGSTGRPGTTSFILGSANGAITGASFSLNDLSFAGVMTLNSASFAYSAQNGQEDFNVAATVTLPGQTGTAIGGHLQMVNGLYASGSITGAHLSVHLLSGVFLQSIGVAIDAPTPTASWRIAGSVGISYGASIKSRSLVEVTGGLSYTFPSQGGGIGTYDFTGALVIGGVTLGTGQLIVSDNPVVHATVVLGPGDGSEGLALGTAAQATGVLHGVVTSSSFSLTGNVSITVGGLTVTAELYLDPKGVAFCTTLPVVGRGGVMWVWGTPPQLVGASCSTAGF